MSHKTGRDETQALFHRNKISADFIKNKILKNSFSHE
jgi:hypothetical protein